MNKDEVIHILVNASEEGCDISITETEPYFCVLHGYYSLQDLKALIWWLENNPEDKLPWKA